jgi:hypothetical protein
MPVVGNALFSTKRAGATAPTRFVSVIENDIYQDSAAAAARPATLPQKVQSPTAVPLT